MVELLHHATEHIATDDQLEFVSYLSKPMINSTLRPLTQGHGSYLTGCLSTSPLTELGSTFMARIMSDKDTMEMLLLYLSK